MSFFRVIEIDGFEGRNYGIATAKKPDRPWDSQCYTKQEATEIVKYLNHGFDTGMQFALDNITVSIKDDAYAELDEE